MVCPYCGHYIASLIPSIFCRMWACDGCERILSPDDMSEAIRQAEADRLEYNTHRE